MVSNQKNKTNRQDAKSAKEGNKAEARRGIQDKPQMTQMTQINTDQNNAMFLSDSQSVPSVKSVATPPAFLGDLGVLAVQKKARGKAKLPPPRFQVHIPARP